MACSTSDLTAKRIGPVICAAAERIHYAENRRSNYSTLGGVLIVASITILTVALGTIDHVMLRFSFVSGAATMFLVGAATLWLYGRQTNRYPFTAATSTWKWFYRDALSESEQFKIPWHAYLELSWKANVKKQVECEYKKQLQPFIEQSEKLKDDDINLEQDIEQLYVLHINELYKNIHLSNIRSFFNGGLVVIVLFSIVGAAFGCFYERQANAPRMFTSSAPTHSENVVIRLTNSPLADVSHFTAKATISNTGNAPFTVWRLAARDADDWLIPLNITSQTQGRTVIKPGSSAKYFFAFTVNSSAASQIKKIEVVVP